MHCIHCLLDQVSSGLFNHTQEPYMDSLEYNENGENHIQAYCIFFTYFIIVDYAIEILKNK